MCRVSKRTTLNASLYMSHPVPSQPWVDVLMDYVLIFSEQDLGNDSIFVVVNRFFLWCTLFHADRLLC